MMRSEQRVYEMVGDGDTDGDTLSLSLGMADRPLEVMKRRFY